MAGWKQNINQEVMVSQCNSSVCKLANQPLQIVRRRNRNNRGGGGNLSSSSAPPPTQQQRPLTRYMPVSMQNENFDLRAHIESAGHQVSYMIGPSII